MPILPLKIQSVLANTLFLPTNSVYSSYEHSLTHESTTSTPNPTIPLDIILETLISISILCVGIVLGQPDLRPIEWRVWACEAEKDERREKGKRAFEAGEGGGAVVGNPFRFLESGERRGFWDGRTKRKEFAAWVRDGSATDVKI
ncbi:hypothetical protein EJ08DRAFT_198626 [Tothia fuscella]|uniref:Uncharacterized protein n=1 Tax=Tothia fuscella TaxID=1048955 RepID=A0A9P4NTH7_9PEZI|nr:hypothetical protein EJ08DRAFT_198626 [Tothia fuscella]